jgi:hypothetical protein
VIQSNYPADDNWNNLDFAALPEGWTYPDRGIAMPVLLGIILGVLLTIAGAYSYDTMSGRAANGLPPSAAGGRPPMVNWDVVSDEWHELLANVRDMGTQLEKGWKKING